MKSIKTTVVFVLVPLLVSIRQVAASRKTAVNLSQPGKNLVSRVSNHHLNVGNSDDRSEGAVGQTCMDRVPPFSTVASAMTVSHNAFVRSSAAFFLFSSNTGAGSRNKEEQSLLTAHAVNHPKVSSRMRKAAFVKKNVNARETKQQEYIVPVVVRQGQQRRQRFGGKASTRPESTTVQQDLDNPTGKVHKANKGRKRLG